ncbi:MAG: 50S ribosomal protein L29 [Anaerolineae bacterium]|nr:50S ribosomal protein L29 [Anaerolineae bacterium]
MEAREIQAMATEEIQRKLGDTQEELFNLRFQWSTRQLKDTNRLTLVQRDIARLKTILRERELVQLGEGED